MPIREFVKPNNTTLRQVNEITDFSDQQLQSAIDDAIDTLHHMQTTKGIGVGLAANQIGEPYAFYVVSITPERAVKERKIDGECTALPTTVFVNPTIKPISSQDTENYQEGCFSLPGIISTSVKRYKEVIVSAYDRHGNKMPDFKVSGFQARVHQHEYDHTIGKEYLYHANIDTKQLLGWFAYRSGQSSVETNIPENIEMNDEQACDFSALYQWGLLHFAS